MVVEVGEAWESGPPPSNTHRTVLRADRAELLVQDAREHVDQKEGDGHNIGEVHEEPVLLLAAVVS